MQPLKGSNQKKPGEHPAAAAWHALSTGAGTEGGWYGVGYWGYWVRYRVHGYGYGTGYMGMGTVPGTVIEGI